jgi:Integrase zinc binding domain
MHTFLIFKEQVKVQGLREKGLSQPHDSMKHIEWYDLLYYKDKIYIPQSLQPRVLSWYHEYLLHPGQTCTEQTIRNTITWPGLTQDIERLCFTCPICQLTKRNIKSMDSCLLRQQNLTSGSWIVYIWSVLLQLRHHSRHTLSLLSL